jgi:hypothetical protein
VSRHLSITTLCSSLHILVMEKFILQPSSICVVWVSTSNNKTRCWTPTNYRNCPPGSFHGWFSLRGTTSAILAISRAHVSSPLSPLYLPLHLYSPSPATRGRGRCPMHRQAVRCSPGSSFSRVTPLRLPPTTSCPIVCACHRRAHVARRRPRIEQRP